MTPSELRALAEAATPGPWEANAVSVWHQCDPEPPMTTETWCGCGRVEHIGVVWPKRCIDSADYSFIAAADPSTVIAILDRLEEAEAALDRAARSLEAVGLSYDPDLHDCRVCRRVANEGAEAARAFLAAAVRSEPKGDGA